jgi:hypothetical protein
MTGFTAIVAQKGWQIAWALKLTPVRWMAWARSI